MMGDTYSTVKDNSDKEWKFYRFTLVADYVSCSPYPPPFNLIFGPIFYIKKRFFIAGPSKNGEQLQEIDGTYLKIVRN